MSVIAIIVLLTIIIIIIINTMKLNEAESQHLFGKKSKFPSFQECKSLNYNSTRLISSHSYIHKPKQQTFPTTQYDKSILYNSNKNDCSDGKDCPNLHKIHSLVSQIEKQKKTIEDLSTLNDFFIHTLNQKDTMYRTILLESNIIKTNKIVGKNKAIATPQNFANRPKSVSVCSPNKLITHNNSNSNIRYDNYSNSKKTSVSNGNLDNSFKNQYTNISNKTKENMKLNNNYYDSLMKISNQSTKNIIQYSSISFLSMSSNMMKEYERNEYVDFLTKITHSEKEFSSMIKVDNKKFASDLCDSIRNISKDFKLMIRLMIRIKLFLRSTHDLVNNMLKHNFNDLVIANACKFLNCEQALLYLYEPISDMLNVFPNDENNRSKVPKDIGIIGHCFTKGENVKIDDTSTDIKYKRDIPRRNIRNILCYPLKTSESEVFGVIETSNKRDNNHFNNDDDELMIIFSNFVSVLIKNNSRNEEYNRTIIQYEKIAKYSIEIQSISNRIDFTERSELLLNSLFYSDNSRLLFVNNSNGKLIHKNNTFVPISNIGIVDYALKRKECFACFKASKCRFYNTLIDIKSSESIVTYPLLIENDCIAIIQFVINEQLDDKREIPKEREMKLLSLINKCIINWYKYNKENVFV